MLLITNMWFFKCRI